MNHRLRENFKVQWHVTSRCNLFCRHCYQESTGVESPDLVSLFYVYERIREFFLCFKNNSVRKTGFHISLTGGEPLIRPDFFSILERIREDGDLLRFSVLTNGTLLTRQLAKELKSFNPAFVQISVEGSEEVHDRIRGKGSYALAVNGAKLLIQEKIPVTFSFTLHHENKDDFSHVVRLAKRLGVRTVWADRLVPFGKALENSLQRVSPEELSAFHIRMAHERKVARRSFISKTDVSMHRALQFQEGGGKPYYCNAGRMLLAIDPVGTVLPCRRMPVSVGNVFQTPLMSIYQENDFLLKLREEESAPEDCRDCFYSRLCLGGLRCLSYALYGSPFHKDQDCIL